MITVRSTINIAHQSVPEVIPAVQGDTGRSILFSLADFTIPTGATARYFITKPSGLAVYNDATIDGNTVLVDLTAQSIAEYGDCPGQVRIMLGQTVVTSFEFILHVEPFRGIDAVESTTETNIFDKAVEDAREAIAEAAEDAEEYISQALDTTLTIPDKAADAKATGGAIRYGAYPFLTAGQLLSTHETTDNTPYNFRAVEQKSTLEYGEIVGGTVAWNQLAKEFASANWITESGVTASYADGVVTVATTVAGNGIMSDTTTVTKDHVYLVGITAKCSAAISLRFGLGSVVLANDSFPASNYVNAVDIKKCTATASNRLALFGASATYTDLMAKDALFIDLTQMLGTTLADYIYGLESATAGAGVTWLRKHFPKMFTYHAYDAGSLVSVEGLSHHVTNTKNLLPLTITSGTYLGIDVTVGHDGSVKLSGTRSSAGQIQLYNGNLPESIKAGESYIYTWGNNVNAMQMMVYDAQNNRTVLTNQANASVSQVTIPANTVKLEVRVSLESTSAYNVMLYPMLRLASVSDAAFVPYTAPHTYPLDSTKTFRGIFKLDSSNRLYADGDVYKPDGTVVKRYGVVDLGTLNWNYNSGSNYFYVLGGLGHKPNGICICPKYIYELSFTSDKICRLGNAESIQVRDSAYSDAAAFKTAMSGVYLVYELAIPTTETADPYTNPQIIAPGGTEEYISTSVVPVGHESSYPLDIAGQLDKILDTPAADGTYTLRATVSGGKVTYSWVSGGSTLMSMRPTVMPTVIEDDEPLEEEEEPVEEELEEEPMDDIEENEEE